MENSRNYYFGIIAIIFAASLWGVDGIVLRPYLYTLPVSLVVFIETAIVSVLLAPVLFIYKNEILSLKKRDWIAFFGVAFFGGAVGTLAITKALFYVDFINLSIVILIQKLQPLFAILLAYIFLKEKLVQQFYLWAVISVIGAYLITFGFESPNISLDNKTFMAALLALLAAFSFGFSTVLSKRALRNTGFVPASYLRFLISSLVVLVLVLFRAEYNAIPNISNEQIIVFLIIAFSTGGLAIFLYYYGLRRVTASNSTIAELAFPLSAILLEYLIFDKVLSTPQWIGAFMLLTGIIKVSIASKK